MTTAEYLVAERGVDSRNEFRDGEMFEMHGSLRHSQINRNLIWRLGAQLDDGPCEVFSLAMRVKVNASFYAYPDMSIVNGEPQFDDDLHDSLLNPTAIIEVYSPETESFDRGRRFSQYKEISTLREYVLIAQDEVCAEHYVRQSNGEWRKSERHGLDAVIDLPSVGATLKLAEVYYRVTL